MGLVHAEIELINAEDVGAARRGFIKSQDVRRMTVNALVDSGAYMMVIPEHVRLQLGVEIIEHSEAEYANGEIETVPVVGPIVIKFANRRTVADAMVLGNQVLLGSIPMEAMDVVIHPRTQTLMVNPENPTMPKMIVK
ncbi:MAG: aspartyl protease family protein [candidate division KSB1 bacterium]